MCGDLQDASGKDDGYRLAGATEAMHFLDDLPRAQHNIWEMVVSGAVQILTLGAEDVPRIRELMDQYSNRPMDLADAPLIRVAERGGHPPVLHRGSQGFLGLPDPRQDSAVDFAVRADDLALIPARTGRG